MSRCAVLPMLRKEKRIWNLHILVEDPGNANQMKRADFNCSSLHLLMTLPSCAFMSLIFQKIVLSQFLMKRHPKHVELHPAALRFLSCMAFSVYEVIRVACLSRGWFVYSS